MRLSIVTVHLDDFAGLRATCASLQPVLDSGLAEWTLIDGGSDWQRSGGESLRAEVTERSDVIVSEPDAGIYDAMNKGTKLATGEYVLYLNAGDELHPDFDWKALAEEIANGSPAMVWGVCHERFEEGTLVKVKNRSPGLAWYGMPVNHQNVLFRRSVLGDAPYDTSYKICADYDLVSRLLKSGETVFRSEMPISIFQRGGTSAARFAQNMAEEGHLRTLHYGVPKPASYLIRQVKTLNAWIGQVPAVRRLLRRWV